MKMTSLFYSIIVFVLTSCSQGEQEVIVVPKKFKGYILVVFDQKNGEPIKYVGAKRLYEIPQNGILKTQFKSNEGLRDFAQYYYDTIMPENKLGSFAEIKRVPSDTVAGFMGAAGTVRKSSQSDDYLEFCEFYIGTQSDIIKSQEQVSKLDIPRLLN
jgi:hypothetical protein